MTLHSAGRQDDGSIIDIYGNRISQEESLKILTAVNSLPAQLEKDNFLHAVDDNNIIIVQGETGSGKSTQLPKFAHFANPNQRIVATQPRVLSATSLAERVSMEILSATGDARYSLGGRIGYRTGRGKNASGETRLSYHTDGTEFMRQSMSGIVPDILFIDEAHGFSIQTEMLAMMARHHNRAMKIVIMSATLDPEIFREYYKDISRDIPLIQIPGRTFGVQANFDTETEMMEDLAQAVIQNQNVLLFSPGKKEIQKQIEAIRNRFGGAVEVFALHAEMPASEQNKLLIKTSSKPRIIVATNIAEESITIPYIDLVIDLGTQKVMRYNAHGTPVLGVENVAFSSAVQRKGRGGRTKPGYYNRYNPIPSEELPRYPEAPIERERIDREILTLLSQGVDIIDMIYDSEKTGKSPFFHHVDMGLFVLSLNRLRTIGALTPENTLTVLGHELLKFPVDVYHARILYEAIERGCVGNVIDMISILEKKGFVSKEGTWQELLGRDQYASDMDAYQELLAIVTSTTISPKKYKHLIELGINEDELKDFQDRNGEVKLYELVDLSSIGIKNKKIKEIDECRETLLGRCATMGIDVTFSGDNRAQLVSLATGYSHNRYIYDEELAKFINPEQGEFADRYKQGDISLIEPRHKGQYIGSPFIIGSSGPGSDLNILTHIISINHSIVSEAIFSNTKYSKEEYKVPKQSIGTRRVHRSPDDIRELRELVVEPVDLTHTEPVIRVAKSKTNTSVTKVLQGGIVPRYESVISEFHITRHASAQDAQHFYLKYCLVPFLFQSNLHVQRYIAGKDGDWVQFFAEILKRFLEEHDLYRIDPTNIAKTEGSFRHDSGIIDRIKESMDSTIRNFRLHGIPTSTTRTFLEIPHDEEVIDNRQSSELVGLKNQYAQLLGQSAQYSRKIPLAFIEELALIKIVSDINEGVGPAKAVQAYIDLEVIMQTIQTLAVDEVQKLSASVKGIGARRKELHKYEVLKAKMLLAQDIINTLSLDSSNHEQVKTIDMKYFGHFTKEDIVKYQSFIARITSSDSRKRKRVIKNEKSGLTYYKGLMRDELSRVEEKIGTLSGDISLEGTQIAKSILSHLDVFVSQIFNEDYRKFIIDPKLYDMMRTILRDNITDKKGLSALLFSGMKQAQMGEHMQGMSAIFKELVAQDDLQYTLDEYKEGGAIYKAILSSNDTEEVEKHVSKLHILVNRLKKSSSKVDNNKLWIMYRNNGK